MPTYNRPATLFSIHIFPSANLKEMLPLWSLILGWFLTAITVTGNSVVIYLITTRRNLRTKTNWFVLSLAVADFGVGAIYFPRFSACWIGKSCTSSIITMSYSLGAFFNYASVTNLCALTLDRYLAIVKPLRYVTFMTKKRVALLILTAWGAGLTVLIYSVILFLIPSGKAHEILGNYVSYIFVALAVCVSIFLLVTTTQIFLIARKHSRQNAAIAAQLNFNYTSPHSNVLRPQEAAASKMIVTVVAVFLICYSLDIVGAFYSERTENFYIVKALFVIMNAAVNPLVYAVLKREMRREIRRLCGYCRRQQLSGFQTTRRDRTNRTPQFQQRPTNNEELM